MALSIQDLQGLVDPKSPNRYHELGATAGLAASLNTDLVNGLTPSQAEESRAKYGSNVLPELPAKSFIELVMEGFEDKTLIMLTAAAFVSLVLGMREDPRTGWIEGAAIIVAVLLVVMVTAANDYEKELQFRKLNAKKDMKEVKVVRGGERAQVMVNDIVVGDIVIVETGDILCADGVFVNGSNLSCDESGATGESDLIKKGSTEGHDPFFISGAQVMDGVGKMLVIAVGEHSFNGKTMMSLRVETEETPLQQKLGELADNIGYFGLVAAVITVACLVVKEVGLYYANDRPFDTHFVSALVRFVITGITILVVAIPEGLPLAVTMALAYSMVKMLEDNNLVRRLEACETMGGATNICSDKTGTLTQNKMTVVEGYLGRLLFQLDNPEETPLKERLSIGVRETLVEMIESNSTAYEPHSEGNWIGSKTESALLTFTRALGGNYKETRKTVDTVMVYPFSSKRKRMSTIVRTKNGLRLYVKGASEIVLGLCNRQLLADGSVTELTASMREDTEQRIHDMATHALRTIGLAYLELEDNTDTNWEQDPKPDEPSKPSMVLVGVVGIQDPVRPEVPDAVRRCQQAGIKVRMVTGDNLTTAREIARKCGILHEDGLCMEGPEFRTLKGQDLDNVIFKLDVLARSSPLDKQILVNRLKDMGEVVAVTGDGTNDGPALKLAHVGFSMGIAGTEVAKEASDIVLMDDNFSSIVKAVSWGRNVYDSIRKFIQFQLTVNIVAVVLAFVGSLTSKEGESPLKPVQLLWVNLIMDTMAALALATEKPAPSLLDRPPYGKNMPLINGMMWRNIIGQALFQFAVNIYALHWPERIFGLPAGPGSSYHDPQYHVLHLTLFFNTFVMCQLFNEINARKIHGELNVFQGFFNSPLFLGVMLFTLVMQYVMVQFGGEWVGCTPLNLEQWLRCIFIGALGLPVGVLIRVAKKEDATRHTAAGRARWQQAKHKLSVVEQFRRKHSIEHHYKRKTSGS
eukprot:comp21496_c0_seq1/m.29799 comp21496_c0_seq1/g.29799  ORF comp21496_c0_seq1/g.29799 comp21496_c0_seq1/m.29799 type:complete len:976 (-) comp21496_c0_seq1:248-3175(-)